jgi:hypothetical protein
MGSIQATIVNGTFDFNLVLALVLPGEGNTPTAAEERADLARRGAPLV